MKLFSSFVKELTLATRSFYFYIEIFFAVVLLAVVLFAIPEQIRAVQTQLLHLDLPQPAADRLTADLLEEDLDGQWQTVVLESGGQAFDTKLIETETARVYIVDSADAVRALADTQRNIGMVLSLDDAGQLHYTYYLQGYESQRLQNLLSVIPGASLDGVAEKIADLPVEQLAPDQVLLNDRENVIPTLIAFNSSFMGMFIMAAYVFLDKKEGVINAYAVTASSVARYLLSKILVVLLTATVSGLIVTVPVFGFQINYGLVLLLLLVSGFFASVLGLLIASFYADITKAFGTVFVVLILLMLPVIAYFLPGWNPWWIRIIPSDLVIWSFREILIEDGKTGFVLMVSAGLLVAGCGLFALADHRYRKTLSVS
ncbi:MAG: ABC transporter permease [Clostridiaceae bacterium]|nr:ABC transporter permease [Clostridiaceae bacterium]